MTELRLIAVHYCGQCPFIESDEPTVNAFTEKIMTRNHHCEKYHLVILDPNIIHAQCELPKITDLKMETRGATIKFTLGEK